MGRGARHAEPFVAGMVWLLQPWLTLLCHGSIGQAHVYDHVRNFLARRQKLPTRGSRHIRMDAVFGTMGVLRPRKCRHTGVLS